MTETYTTVTAAEDVTEEILAAVVSIHDGWYADVRVDWDDLLNRVDGIELEDGTTLDLGKSMMSPAILHIKARIRAHRRS